MGHLEYVGQTVGDYHLLRWLGGGGFGNVYLAEQEGEGQLVAVKMLQIRMAKQDDLRAFITEARMMRLRHPHIMPLLDFGLNRDNTPFLVMEYAPKGTLRDRHPKSTQVPLPTVIEYASQVAAALQYAHDSRLVHRDVKPENMLVRADGTILLSDFGIATAAHSTYSISVNQGMVGTVCYMAPEQLSGKPRAASDQYALAVVIYEWLSGCIPFQGTAVEMAMQHVTLSPPSLIAQVPHLPSAVEAVLFKALAKDYKDRFPSMQSFITALQQASSSSMFHSSSKHMKSFVSDAPSQKRMVVAPLNTPVPLYMRRRGLSKKWGVLLILLSVLLVGGGIFYAYSLMNSVQGVSDDAYSSAVTQRGIMWGFDAAHTRTNPYEHILNSANVSQLHQAWVVLDGNAVDSVTASGFINSSPVVANGMVYVGSDDYKLYAFDAASGQQKWVASNSGVINSSPAIANGMVYVGSGDDNLYAFDAISGQQKWAAPTGGVIDSSPLVARGVVYVGSADHRLYAFDATTGQQKWVASTGGVIDSTPAIANGMVYVGSDDYKFYAFDATTGQQKWAAPTGGVIDSSPAIANGMVYISSDDYKFYAFDATTGQQKWVATGRFNLSSPAIANGMVYVGSDDHKLYALAANSGQMEWNASTGGVIASSPIIANGVVYVGSADHKLYAFDVNSGQQKWVATTGGVIDSTPTIANGMVYVSSDDHKLYAFSLPKNFA